MMLDGTGNFPLGSKINLELTIKARSAPMCVARGDVVYVRTCTHTSHARSSGSERIRSARKGDICDESYRRRMKMGEIDLGRMCFAARTVYRSLRAVSRPGLNCEAHFAPRATLMSATAPALRAPAIKVMLFKRDKLVCTQL